MTNESTPLLTTTTTTTTTNGNHHHHQQHQRENSIQSGLNEIVPLPRMEIRCHAISPQDGQQTTIVEHCSTKDALRDASQQSSGKNKRQQGQQHYWIDIDADHHDESDDLRQWLTGLNLPNFLIDLLSEPPEQWASQVVPLSRAALAVIRILPERHDSDEVVHVAALQTRSLLLTFTSCPRSETGALYEPVLAQMKRRGLAAPTNSGVLLAWLHFHIGRTSRYTRELRRSVLTMDEAMDRDIASVRMDDLIAAKDQLLRLLSVAEEQNECLESLAGVAATDEAAEAAAAATALDFGPVRGSLSILLATAGSTERMALRLEKNLVDLRQRHEDHDQQVMNRRLGVLTVFSAIFLPLTLLTGLWGMNFQDMPELSEPYAYPIALLFMLSIAIIMICYFRKNGWFD